MTLRPCSDIFGLCLPYNRGVRPAVEVYFCGFGVLIFPHCGDGFEARVDRAFIHGTVA